MVKLLNSIKSPIWRSFAWRVYNVFRTSVFPIMAGAITLYLQNNNLPIAISSFSNVELWDYVLGSLVISLISSVAAGAEKAVRKSAELEEEILGDQG